ncbi:class I SAM-dependent methyltransferase [Aquicella lusitana]|uniref:Ribosomal RNA small subunit methyltransferase J n=1 Tax=Aquicella lusitana TaxID=254246 RepID=A0A370H3J4_9COXI|nr:class I SAM-dependent methyltransferase [Aquicella lusitana]RDI48633.1 16S rRNA (guanine1516-N2)-methyltransferase [Aquicella lusitana]VVC73990.1 Ribosomal RNA small subunit methyltransferase J [Aquicella lusitana]
MIPQRIAVLATSPQKRPEAQALAVRLGIPYIADLKESAALYDYLLVLTPDYLALQKTSDTKQAPFHIDYLSGKLRYRSKQAGLRNELLARAMGINPRCQPVIVDATAGLGRDSFILATLGFHIILLERSPILYVLLEDALQRAQKDPNIALITNRLRLIETDAITWLQSLPRSQRPDIIYLDPMFPPRKKSASVKKEMVILQNLLGKDEDANMLFEVALSCAASRVVVKRPRTAVNIAERAPHFSILGKSNRFDIYLTS